MPVTIAARASTHPGKTPWRVGIPNCTFVTNTHKAVSSRGDGFSIKECALRDMKGIVSWETIYFYPERDHGSEKIKTTFIFVV